MGKKFIFSCFVGMVFFSLRGQSPNGSNCSNELIKNGYEIITDIKLDSSNYIIYAIEPQIMASDSVFRTPITDFEILDCRSNQILGAYLFCMSDTMSETNDDYVTCLWRNAYYKKLSINTIELEFLYPFPVGEDWAYKTLPYFKQTIQFSNSEIRVMEEGISTEFNTSEMQYNELISDYIRLSLKYKSNPFLNDSLLEIVPDFMNRIFLCALIDHSDAKRIFYNLPKQFPGWIQGIVDEHYYNLIEIMNKSAKYGHVQRYSTIHK